MSRGGRGGGRWGGSFQGQGRNMDMYPMGSSSPPKLYPQLDRPLDTTNSSDFTQKEKLEIGSHREMAELMQTSPFYLHVDDGERAIERYSDRHKAINASDRKSLGEALPRELRPEYFPVELAAHLLPRTAAGSKASLVGIVNKKGGPMKVGEPLDQLKSLEEREKHRGHKLEESLQRRNSIYSEDSGDAGDDDDDNDYAKDYGDESAEEDGSDNGATY